MTATPASAPVPYALTARARAALARPGFPHVVCLCGSTRFHAEFRAANLRLTLAGQIVLSIGCDTKSDADLAEAAALGGDPAEVKARLDDLHKRKIDLADYVLVLNAGGYTGASTRSEIAYARATGTPVTYLEPPGDGGWSCRQCGAGFFSTAPENGLCPACAAAPGARFCPESLAADRPHYCDPGDCCRGAFTRTAPGAAP